MERGICKIAHGWWTKHSEWVEYESGRTLEMPEELYRAGKYEPAFEKLLECTKLSEFKPK
jgi:hypothetical protein